MVASSRILKDLSPETKALIEKLQSGQLSASDLAARQSKEPRVYVGEYTPKKGKDAGKTSLRLFVEGDFFPVLLKQDPCKVMLDNLDVIQRFAKTGK